MSPWARANKARKRSSQISFITNPRSVGTAANRSIASCVSSKSASVPSAAGLPPGRRWPAPRPPFPRTRIRTRGQIATIQQHRRDHRFGPSPWRRRCHPGGTISEKRSCTAARGQRRAADSLLHVGDPRWLQARAAYVFGAGHRQVMAGSLCGLKHLDCLLQVRRVYQHCPVASGDAVLEEQHQRARRRIE